MPLYMDSMPIDVSANLEFLAVNHSFTALCLLAAFLTDFELVDNNKKAKRKKKIETICLEKGWFKMIFVFTLKTDADIKYQKR